MAENHPEIRSKIRSFILKDLLSQRSAEVGDDTNLFTTRLIDSFALAELGVFIEREFGIYVPDADLTSEKMDTITLIVKRIAADQKE